MICVSRSSLRSVVEVFRKSCCTLYIKVLIQPDSSLGLALFLFAIDETIVATSVSTIGAELDIKGSLSWITTSYLLTTTVIQPVTGRIADAVGVKPLVFLELWVFIVGNIIAGTSRGLLQMIVGRLISGIGGAGLLSLTGIIIAQLTHEKQRGAYMNIFNIVFILSDSIGPIAGGALANAGQWRWVFLFTAPFGPVITIFLWATLRIPPPASRIRTFREALAKIDLIGMLLIVVSLSCLVVALNMGGQDLPWNSSVVIGCFAGAGASFLAFIVVETKAEMPVLPVELFSTWKWRNVSYDCCANIIVLPYICTGFLSSCVSSSNFNVFGSLVCIDHPILDHGSNLQYCYELACAQMGWWLRVESFVRHTSGNFGWWDGSYVNVE